MSNGLKHVLRFKSVQDSDLGIYTCKAENPHGQAEAAIEMSGNKNENQNLFLATSFDTRNYILPYYSSLLR